MYVQHDSTPIGKYATCTTDRLFLQGKAALLEQGVAHCKATLRNALWVFRSTARLEVCGYGEESTISADDFDMSDIEGSDTDYSDYDDM